MQPSSDHGLPVDHNDHLRPTVGSAVDHSNPPTPEQASEPLLATSEMHKQLADLKEACAIANTDADRWNRIAVERLVEIERLSTQSLPVDHYKLLEPTPESQVNESEPLEVSSPPVAASEPAIEVAIALEEAPHLTREQLGKQFEVSRESIRKWEADGKLAEKGWELVPGTGTNPKNPRLYRLIGTDVL